MSIQRVGSNVARSFVSFCEIWDLRSVARVSRFFRSVICDGRTAKIFAGRMGVGVSWRDVLQSQRQKNQRFLGYLDPDATRIIRVGDVIDQARLILEYANANGALERAADEDSLESVTLLLELGCRAEDSDILAAVINDNRLMLEALVKCRLIFFDDRQNRAREITLMNQAIKSNRLDHAEVYLGHGFRCRAAELYERAHDVEALRFLDGKGIKPPKTADTLRKFVQGGDADAVAFLLQAGVPATRELFVLSTGACEFFSDPTESVIPRMLAKEIHLPIGLRSMITSAYNPTGLCMVGAIYIQDFMMMIRREIEFPLGQEYRTRLITLTQEALQLLDPEQGKIPRGGDPKEQLFQLSLYVDGHKKDLDERMRNAAAKGDLETVKRLVSLGAELTSKHMEIAARFGHERIVDYLLEKGVAPTPRAAEIARKHGHAEIADLMIRKTLEEEE